MRGAIPLRLLHQLSVVFHAGAKPPLVNLRLLEHQHFILLIVARRSIEIICRGIDPSQSLPDAEDRLYLRSISYVIRGTNAVQNPVKQGLTSITAKSPWPER